MHFGCIMEILNETCSVFLSCFKCIFSSCKTCYVYRMKNEIQWVKSALRFADATRESSFVLFASVLFCQLTFRGTQKRERNQRRGRFNENPSLVPFAKERRRNEAWVKEGVKKMHPQYSGATDVSVASTLTSFVRVNITFHNKNGTKSKWYSWTSKLRYL